MQTACGNISKGIIKRRGFNIGSKVLGLIQGSFFPGMERRAADKVWIEGDCNQCGLCVFVSDEKLRMRGGKNHAKR